MATLFTASDIQARLSSMAYTRLYAKSGGATVDSTFVTTIIAEADSAVRMVTKAAFPDGFDATGGTVDPAIIGACVDIANEIAASRHPAATEMSGYFLAGKRARDFLKSLNRDMDARPVTAATGRAKPRARTDNQTNDAGDSTSIFSRIADQKDVTGF